MPTPPPRRAWGTRFDSLVDTPDVRGARDAVPDLTAEKERSGEYDRVYSRPALSAPTTSNDPSPLPVRMPHDASVFVASLPSHVPEQELQAHLSTHLSQHATIKHIKLIRDNRGAVCAFVQVESAAQATNLIAACNLSLFMDRHIRCEVARAFRTLLVSWKPVVPPSVSGTNAADDDTTGRALRLRRCKGSRYIHVSLGADALQTDLAQLPNYSSPRAEDPLSGSGVFFPSGVVEGNFEALKGLLEAFGPLEFITPFEPVSVPKDCDENGFVRGGPGLAVKHEDGVNNAPPEGGPRSPMWAAKWEHRNDAVSAITALQLVPNLFICWSHTYGRPPYQSNFTPRSYGETQSRDSSGMHTPSYPPASFQGEQHDAEAQWAPRLQQLHAQALASDGSKPQESVGFSESDFPPLRVDGGAHMLGGRGRGKRGAWVAGRKTFVRAGAPSPPPISTSMPTISRLYNGTGPNTPTSAVPNTPDLDSVVEPSPLTPGFPITPRTPSGGYAPGDEAQKDTAYVASSYTGFPQRRNDDGSGDGRELFVGGLDAATWDEERVHNVFGRFGALEEVRFVKPGLHAPPFKRAFAFIKFAEQEASQKAIAEEHLRIYDDRRIKVQLREAAGRRWTYRGRGRFQHGLLRADRGSLDFDHDISAADAVEGKHGQEGAGHVRFASVPNGSSMHIDAQLQQQSFQRDAARDSVMAVSKIKTEDTDDGFIGNSESRNDANPAQSSTTSSIGSGCVPDASMEAQPRSADTTVTLADVTVSPTPATTESPQQEQSEQDAFTAVSSTPPPSNPDAASTYAASSEGSAPTSTGYYPTTPSWIPPYAIPHAPYGPYGFYPQQVPGQSGVESSSAYPWMATVYRNVMPFVPWFNPPPGVEIAAPPVRPTGYIQRDPGGIFIPVYPPERLGQYMSTSGATIDQPQSQGQAGSAPPTNWQNIPPHPQLYPVPFPMQQTVVMQQQAAAAAAQQQQQLPMTGNGWITGPPPGNNYSSQQAAPSSAPPPYPTPNAYYQTPSSAAPPHARQNMYGPYDPTLQHAQKPQNRRNGEYGPHQHRFGPREGRAAAQRRGPNINPGDQSFGAGNTDQQFAYAMKTNGTQSTQPAITPSGSNGSNGSEWNWKPQNR